MQEPSVRTSSREQPPQRLELWHSGSVTRDSLASGAVATALRGMCGSEHLLSGAPEVVATSADFTSTAMKK